MMRPCSFQEAWEPLISSKKNEKHLQQPNSSLNTTKNAVPVSVSLPAHQSHNCEQYLLHLISCPHCIKKLQELSKIYNPTSSPTQFEQMKMYEQFVNQHDQFPFSNILKNIQKNDRINDMIFSIIIGILIAYLVMNVSKK